MQHWRDSEVIDGMIQVIDAGGEKVVQASERFMSKAFDLKQVTLTICGTAFAITMIVVFYKGWEHSKSHQND